MRNPTNERLLEMREAYERGALKWKTEPTRSRCADAVLAIDELLRLRARIDVARANLEGVDLKALEAGEGKRPTLTRVSREGPIHGRDHLAKEDLRKINAALVWVAPRLIAAAKEAADA